MAQLHKGVKGPCLLLLFVFLASSESVLGQANGFLRQGNQLYEKQQFDAASQTYLKALQKDPNNTTGLFNLGNSLYQGKHYDSSRKVMTATANAIKDKGGKAAANYNIGNTYMAQQKWEDAISSYKNTLRNNPQDADAKYNLAYAEQMLKKEQQNGGSKNDKKEDKKDKKDKKEQDKRDKDGKDKDKQENKDGDDKDEKGKPDDKNPQPKSQPSKLSQQQAEQLLNALQQEEKKLQDKLKKEKGIPVKMDKDW